MRLTYHHWKRANANCSLANPLKEILLLVKFKSSWAALLLSGKTSWPNKPSSSWTVWLKCTYLDLGRKSSQTCLQKTNCPQSFFKTKTSRTTQNSLKSVASMERHLLKSRSRLASRVRLSSNASKLQDKILMTLRSQFKSLILIQKEMQEMTKIWKNAYKQTSRGRSRLKV